MVPSIEPGKEIEIQIQVLLTQSLFWQCHPSEAVEAESKKLVRQFARGTNLYHLRGVIVQAAGIPSTITGESPPLEAFLLDCDIPILVRLPLELTQDSAKDLRVGSVLEMLSPLWGSLWWHAMPFQNRIKALVKHVREEEVAYLPEEKPEAYRLVEAEFLEALET